MKNFSQNILSCEKNIIGVFVLNKKYNITAIAKLAGVSPATVSRTLNNHPYVTREVQGRVFDAIHRLGYQPRTPSDKKRLAIIINDRHESELNSYGSSMLFHLTCQCERHNTTAEIFGVSNMELLEENFLRAAIVFQDFLTEKILKRFPYTQFISVNNRIPGCALVCSDEKQGVALAFNHLRNRGHRRIAMLLPNTGSNSSVVLRRAAFCELSAAAGIRDPDSMIAALLPHPFESIVKLLRSVKPDALLVAGEDMLFLANYAVAMLGLNVPGNISIVSYENYYVSRYMVPPHTTVAQDFEHLAENAVLLARKVLLENVSVADSEIILPNRLIERDSVKRKDSDAVQRNMDQVYAASAAGG